MSNVQVAIGVRWAIVESKRLLFRSVLPLPVVEIVGTLSKVLLSELGVRTSTARSDVLNPHVLTKALEREKRTENSTEAASVSISKT